MGVTCGNDEYDEQEIHRILIFRKQQQAIKENNTLSSENKQKQLNKLVNDNTGLLISCPDLLSLKVNELNDLLVQAKQQNQQAVVSRPVLSKMDNSQAVSMSLVDENQTQVKNKTALNSVVESYNKSHKQEGSLDYKPGCAEPKIKGNEIHLQFPTPKDSCAFMQTLAEEKNRFFVLDKNNHVKAYSTGDGQLYRADGTAYEKGAALESSTLTQADVAKQLLEAAPQSPSPK